MPAIRESRILSSGELYSRVRRKTGAAAGLCQRGWPGPGRVPHPRVVPRRHVDEPRDVAWVAGILRPGRVGAGGKAGDAAALTALREALEGSLGVRFEGDRGAAFFASTFGADPLLRRVLRLGVVGTASSDTHGAFNWHEAVWHLRAPVLRALFQQLSDPGRLQPLGLVEVLDWTTAALNRVDRDAFFAQVRRGRGGALLL